MTSRTIRKLPYLPLELKEMIWEYLPFEQLIYLSNRLARKAYDEEEHDWYWAATNGKLGVIKWFHVNKIERCSDRIMDRAAGEGQLEVIKFLHENRSEGCTKYAMDWAATNGHLNVVKFLHEN